MLENPPDYASHPRGLGPALTWWVESKKNAIQAGAVGFLLVVVGMFVIQGLLALTYWWITFPVAVIAGGLIYFTSSRTPPIAAGARWMRKGRNFVRLYELNKVWYTVHPFGTDGSMRFTDKRGGDLSVKVSTLMENPLLFDLVRNGVLHSAIKDHADMNRQARNHLDIPYPRET